MAKAFQESAFQNNAFQIVSTVAFQCNAFQRNAFQSCDPEPEPPITPTITQTGGGGFRIHDEPVYTSGGLHDSARELLDQIFLLKQADAVSIESGKIELQIEIAKRRQRIRNLEALILILAEV